ncbi:hypothetical protein IMCC3135_30740 [Granulosicoccus antarcticus IMCC3135]|uniref:Uncharacterized protein n=2 Tax=Granulosicoccus TaxID=437504 RepID=A0A2Z2P669_9GAMM|nr:hypothetical protein IMCC3135_30740 [Granulosicoccus antarcticus IMCC3135]
MCQSIVLDKSYLQATGAIPFRDMLKKRRFLMPSVLFYELMSTSEPGRSRCFAKIPEMENPFDVITDIDNILHAEIETQEPFGVLEDYSVDAPYFFNPKFKEQSAYDFTDTETRLLGEWEKYFAEQVKLLSGWMENLYVNFPKLKEGSTEQRSLKHKEIEAKIVGDEDVIRLLYDAIWQPEKSKPPWPRADTIDSHWALYRWVQAKLLFALDAGVRYQGSMPKPMSTKTYTKFEHDMIDLEYLVQGVLQGSFATKEIKLKNWFLVLRPDGEVLA